MFWKKILSLLLISHVFCCTTFADEVKHKIRQHHKKNTPVTIKIPEKIDLNEATESSLAEIPGMNGAKAKAIIKFRKEKGNFTSLEELANVKGFKRLSPEKRQELEKYLIVIKS